MGIDMRALGKRITTLRKEMGETTTDFAILAGLARSHMYKLESGDFPSPSVTSLDRVARALGITLDQLVGRRPRARGGSEPAGLPVPASLTRFVREWETRHRGRMPKDVFRSLATLQFRGKRPRTVEDWRLIYAVVERTLRD